MKNYNSSSLKALGIMMIIFAVIYALVGTLALAGVISGALTGHENEEVIIVVLGYVVALLALICGVVCVGGNIKASKFMGIIFAVLGLIALIYQQAQIIPSVHLIAWQCALVSRFFQSLPKQKNKDKTLESGSLQSRRFPVFLFVA